MTKYLTERVRLRRWEHKDGKRTFADILVKVDVTIDWDALLRHLGDKALSNKSGKTRILNGLITAEAHRVEMPAAARPTPRLPKEDDHVE